MTYSWLDLATVERAVPAMRARGVSAVARGDQTSAQTGPGFLPAYRRSDGSAATMARLPATSGSSWAERRAGFLARHLAQADDHAEPWWETVHGVERPTRRHLALVAWAYSPTPAKLRRWLGRTNNTRRNGYNADSILEYLPEAWQLFADRHRSAWTDLLEVSMPEAALTQDAPVTPGPAVKPIQGPPLKALGDALSPRAKAALLRLNTTPPTRYEDGTPVWEFEGPSYPLPSDSKASGASVRSTKAIKEALEWARYADDGRVPTVAHLLFDLQAARTHYDDVRKERFGKGKTRAARYLETIHRLEDILVQRHQVVKAREAQYLAERAEREAEAVDRATLQKMERGAGWEADKAVYAVEP
jgi:hypothetical protein